MINLKKGINLKKSAEKISKPLSAAMLAYITKN